jgi:hypothetical protein
MGSRQQVITFLLVALEEEGSNYGEEALNIGFGNEPLLIGHSLDKVLRVSLNPLF